MKSGYQIRQGKNKGGWRLDKFLGDQSSFNASVLQREIE